MALRKCPDCGSRVSESAHTCPQCGRPLQFAPSKGPVQIGCCSGLVIIFAGVCGLLVLFAAFSGKKTAVENTPAVQAVQAPPAAVAPVPAVAPAPENREERIERLRAEHKVPRIGGPELEPDDPNDVVGGLPKRKRVEIYQELHRSGMLATYEAESKYPFNRLTSAKNPGAYLAGRKKVYEAAVKRGRVALVKKYNVDGATLDKIDEEGADKRWPIPEVENPHR